MDKHSFWFSKRTNLFYYQPSGDPMPIGCYYNRRIHIFLNLETAYKATLTGILDTLMQTERSKVDVAIGRLVEISFEKLTNVAKKRTVYLAKRDGNTINVVRVHNVARTSTPDPRLAHRTATIILNDLSPELLATTMALTIPGSRFELSNDWIYLPIMVGDALFSEHEGNKPISSEEVRLKKELDAFVDNSVKYMLELLPAGPRGYDVVMTMYVGNKIARRFPLGEINSYTFKSYGNCNPTLEPEFEPWKTQISTAISTHRLTGKPVELNTPLGETLISAADIANESKTIKKTVTKIPVNPKPNEPIKNINIEEGRTETISSPRKNKRLLL